LYAVKTDDPEGWIKEAEPITTRLRQQAEDRAFFEMLGSEIGPDNCRHEGCERKRIEFSVMCQCHHFEMVMKRRCPFW
jgi:hypothetical protein